jgi:hypothetical protein
MIVISSFSISQVNNVIPDAENKAKKKSEKSNLLDESEYSLSSLKVCSETI